MSVESLWIGIGIIGQLAFTGRFLVQWICSESAGRSVVPVAFWYLSLAGGLILLTYAIHRRDPVFIFGQLSGMFVYVRNLMLVRREVAQIQTSAQGSFGHDSTPEQ
ncbi:MAG: lipid A biosynthesis protein [Planctomycetota bacterium]|nr:MAG: lipid A biosynthesis protein [Planctomycetota bacterium]